MDRKRLLENIIRTGGSDEVLGRYVTQSAETTEKFSGEESTEEWFENFEERFESPTSNTPRIDPSKLELIELEMEQSVRVNTRSTAIRQLALLLACTTQIRDISNFAAMFTKNGGIIFLFVYILMLFVVGIPLGTIEMTMGQYTSLPAFTLFGRIAPVFSGCGFLLIFVRVMYSLFVALEPKYVLFFFQFVRTLVLGDEHWLSCRHYPAWICKETRQNCTEDQASIAGRCIHRMDEDAKNNFSSYSRDAVMTYYTSLNSDVSFSPAAIFHLQKSFIAPYEQWWAGFAILCMAGLIVHQGTRFFSRIAHALCVIPIIAMFLVACFSIHLDGFHALGEAFAPRWSALWEWMTWVEAIQAGGQAMGLGGGTLLTISSLGDFNNNIFRDMLLVGLFGTLIRVLGVCTFVPILSLSKLPSSAWNTTGMLVQSGNSVWDRLIFTGLPGIDKENESMTMVITIFYLAMIVSMLGYQVITLEICLGACFQSFPRILYLPDSFIRFCVTSIIIAAFGIILGFAHWYDFRFLTTYIKQSLYLDTFALIVLFQIFIFSYGYGVRRLLVNLTTMCGRCLPPWSAKYVSKIIYVQWAFLMPLVSLITALLTGLRERFSALSGRSVIFTAIGLLPIFFGVRKISHALVNGQEVRSLFQTHRKWRPINIHNRRQAEHDERAARILF